MPTSLFQKHFIRMAACKIGNLGAADHSRKLFNAPLAIELLDRYFGAVSDDAFLDRMMHIGEPRHLRLMSNAEYLICSRKSFEALAHGFRHSTAYSDIHLIEDQRSRILGRRGYGLQGEHQARYLAARSYLGERAQFFSHIGRNQKLNR